MKNRFRPLGLAFAVLFSPALLALAQAAPAATLQDAARLLHAEDISALEYSGSGAWYQFGQAPSPGLAWPQFSVTRHVADFNYDTVSARVQQNRIQVIEPARVRPTPVEQRPDQYLRGDVAWNLAPAGRDGAEPVATPQPAAVEERTAELWSSPQGFVRAALRNHATEAPAPGAAGASGKVLVTFSPDGRHRYEGLINPAGQLERVRTWIDNPVLGDTEVETRYSGYRDFGGVIFPAHLVRVQGGHPVLDLEIAAVRANPVVDLTVPKVASAPAAPVAVVATALADGVLWLTGGTHHSVAIEQKDHVVVVEAPLNEERSLAVIEKVHASFPGKPIRYLINTHAHFDHAGGLRTYADAGATIVTHALDVPWYKQAWAAPRTLQPDHLAVSGKAPVFLAFNGRKVLGDASRPIEIYPIQGNTHSDAFALVYLPKEKILIEADAFNPPPANSPVAAVPNPYTVNLHDNIQRLRLEVAQIAPLHGTSPVSLADLRSAIGVRTAER